MDKNLYIARLFKVYQLYNIAKRKEQPLRVVLMIYFMQHLCSKVSLSQGESVTARTTLTMKSSSSECDKSNNRQQTDPGNRQQNSE